MSRPARSLSAALAAIGALVAWSTAAEPAAAYVLVTTAEGVPIHWTQRCVELWSHDQLFYGLDAAVAHDTFAASAATWSAVECTWLELATRGFTCFDDIGLSDFPGSQNVLTWPEGPGSWSHVERVVALTSVTYDRRDGEIVDADIELNGEDYAFGVGGEGDRYDLQQTLTHELGHVLGLDHSAQLSATMYHLSWAGETRKRSLSDDDVAGLCASHPLASAPADGSCKAVPPRAIEDPWCPTPRDDGCGGAPSGGLGWLLALALGLALGAARVRPRRRREEGGP